MVSRAANLDDRPDFALDGPHGRVRLRDFLANGQVLLMFYPGDDKPVCTEQLCDHRDNLTVFADRGAQVIEIDHRRVESHRALADRVPGMSRVGS